MDKTLISMLICPLCKGKLQEYKNEQNSQHELICNFDKLAFSINNGIPNMLVNQARNILTES